jgi:hypothetical protein
MKRLLIFGLFGPLLGLILLARTPNPSVLAALVLWSAPAAYLFGLLPALVTGVADWSYSRLIGLWPRVALTGAIGSLGFIAD